MATSSSDLTIVKRDTGSTALKPPKKVDIQRWVMAEVQHLSLEEIANRHNVTVKSVADSITRYETFRSMTSMESINTNIRASVLRLWGKGEKALEGALEAENVVLRTNPDTGKAEEISRTPDNKTRLSAFDRLIATANRELPKGGGVNVNVQQNQQTVHAETGPRSLSFEELLRQRREVKGLTNGDAVQDVDYEDVDESAEEDEEEDESGE